jgi:hypothetical protein
LGAWLQQEGKGIPERTLDVDGRWPMDSATASAMEVETAAEASARRTGRAESRASSAARDSEVEASAAARASLTSATAGARTPCSQPWMPARDSVCVGRF